MLLTIASEHMEIVTKNPFDVMTKVKKTQVLSSLENTVQSLLVITFAGP